jgi:hypothetical protein
MVAEIYSTSGISEFEKRRAENDLHKKMRATLMRVGLFTINYFGSVKIMKEIPFEIKRTNNIKIYCAMIKKTDLHRQFDELDFIVRRPALQVEMGLPIDVQDNDRYIVIVLNTSTYFNLRD